jgi:hypothetical protein
MFSLFRYFFGTFRAARTAPFRRILQAAGKLDVF